MQETMSTPQKSVTCDTKYPGNPAQSSPCRATRAQVFAAARLHSLLRSLSLSGRFCHPLDRRRCMRMSTGSQVITDFKKAI
jgi:hypothetical protein